MVQPFIHFRCNLREYSSMAVILGLYLGMMADLLEAEFRWWFEKGPRSPATDPDPFWNFLREDMECRL